MEDAARQRLVEYVKPLAAGLDGVTYFGDVERVAAVSETIAQGRADLDRDLLYMLALFSGQERWVAKMGHGSRTEIFLASLGVAPRAVRAVLRGLSRLTDSPATPEEEVVHDALRLEGLGATGIVRLLLQGYRERLEFSEMAAAIEEAAGVSFKTAAAQALAAQRRRTMLDFAARLRAERTQFETEERDPRG